MSDFETKMHHIRFQLGLRPRPQWGSLQRSPRLPSWILRGPSKGGKGRGKERWQGRKKGKGKDSPLKKPGYGPAGLGLGLKGSGLGVEILAVTT